MSQPNRPRKGAQPETRQSPVLAAAAAVAVIVVFVVLGFMLAGRAAGPAVATAPTPDVFAYATATAEALVAAPTPAPAVDDIAARANKYPAAPAMSIDPARQYTATITTPRGDIVIQLRPDLAPQTVNSFVFLAREGYFEGLTWHRVIPGFVVQGGDPTGTGGGGPGYLIPAEFTEKVLFDKPGIVAMARPGNDINGNGSQFFITLAPTPDLNGQYTIFGEVIQGQEIVAGIPERDPAAATTPGEQMLKITITEQ